MTFRFFALTFAATWSLWAGARMLSADEAAGIGVAALAQAVFLLGVFSPGLVALALTYHTDGGAAVERLVNRVAKAHVDLRWYAFALAFMPATKLLAALTHRLALGEWPMFGATPWYAMAAAMLISTWVQAGEELGWRGYALPRLARRFGLGAASLILGLIWAVWHLPLFLVPGGDTFGQSFPVYLIQVTALSVVLAWLYWRTQGSLLLVMILHASVNNTKDIVPSVVPGASDAFVIRASHVGWLTLAILWAAAAVLLTRMRGVSLPGTRDGASPEA